MRALLVEKARGWHAPWPEDLPPDLLKKGLRFSLPPGTLEGRPKSKEKEEEDAVICEALDWSLVWPAQSGETELRVEVREIRSPMFSRLSEDNKVWLVVPAVVLSLAFTALLVFAVSNYPQPRGFWGLVGHYVRGAVGWSLVGLGIGLSLRIGGSPGPETFTRRYLSFLVIMLGFIAAFAWSQVSLRPAGMPGSPEGDVLYLEYLGSRARTLWPMMAGVLPWLALGLEALGAGIMSKIIGALGKQAGKSEK